MQYREAKIVEWLDQRTDICDIKERTDNYRSNQRIYDFADQIYPDLPKATSVMNDTTDHDGVFFVPADQAHDHYKQHRPVVLRNSKSTDALDLPARNFGVARGRRSSTP